MEKKSRIAYIILVFIILAQFLYMIYTNIDHKIERLTISDMLMYSKLHSISGWMEASVMLDKQIDLRLYNIEGKLKGKGGGKR